MLEHPLIAEEFKQIVNGAIPDVYVRLECIIIANGRRLKIPNIGSRDNIRDYEKQYTDEEYISLQVGYTTYKDYILPYLDNLTVELIRKPTDTLGGVLKDRPVKIKTFNGYIIDPPNLNMIQSTRGKEDREINEASGFVNIHLQLLDKLIDEMRVEDLSGPYRRSNVENVLMSAMSAKMPPNATGELLKSKAYEGLKGVDIVPVHNTTLYEHLIVPVGTKTQKLAGYLQREKGVYGTGIGRFYQNQRWFIYPLFSHDRFTDTKKRMTIYNVPKGELLSPERSFSKRGEELFVLGTGDKITIDTSESTAMNVGTGVRFVKADSLIDGMVDVKGNKALPKVKDTNKTISITNRQNEINNLPLISRRVTNNPYPELSEMCRAKGLYLSLLWENAKPELLYPGMPIKVVYEVQGVIKEAFGTLLGVKIKEAPATAKIQDNLYLTNCRLVIHINK